MLREKIKWNNRKCLMKAREVIDREEGVKTVIRKQVQMW